MSVAANSIKNNLLASRVQQIAGERKRERSTGLLLLYR